MKLTNEEMHPAITCIPQKKRVRQVPPLPSRNDILLRAVGLLAARAPLFPGVAPFGLVFLAMERKFSVQTLISLLMVSLGYISLGDLSGLRYIGACITFVLLLLFAEQGKELPRKSAAVLAASAVLFFDALFLLWTGISLQNLFVVLLDLALTALAVLVFDRCRSLLCGKPLKTYIPTLEERFSFYVLLGIVLLSFQSIRFVDWFSIANVLGFLILGVIAVSCGLSGSTAAGLGIGCLLGLQGELPLYLGFFGACGMTCGLCLRFQKYGVAGALTLTSLFLSAYLYGNELPPVHYLEAPIAAGILLLLPPSAFRLVRRFSLKASAGGATDSLRKEQLQTRLRLAAGSFKALSETFERLSAKQKQTNLQDIAALFDIAAEHVCRNCSRSQDCWRRNFNTTYKTLFLLLEKLERKGILQAEDVDPAFSARCLHFDALLREINQLFEVYKINQIWKGKFAENRALVGEQFAGISEVFSRLGEELDTDSAFDQSAADEIRCLLEKQGIAVKDAQVFHAPDGQQRVQLALYNHLKSDRAYILSTLKSVLGKPFSPPPSWDMPTLQFAQTPTLRIDAAVASAGKEKESGDSHRCNLLCGGKYIATLSDGMGTGPRANQESSMTIDLLEAFMQAGFDKTIAVKLINSVMVMKSAGEVFATVDMCMVDLYTGEAEFIKNGAEPSYIKRSNGVETVRSASLPVGVISGIEAETFAHRLSCDDTVVMVSDGLTLRDSESGWLRHALEKAAPELSPQSLADHLLQEAISLKNGVADDDMTVLVLRLCQAA